MGPKRYFFTVAFRARAGRCAGVERCGPHAIAKAPKTVSLRQLPSLMCARQQSFVWRQSGSDDTPEGDGDVDTPPAGFRARRNGYFPTRARRSMAREATTW